MAILRGTYYFDNIAGNYLIAKSSAGITKADGCKISNGQITRYVTESELLTPIEITLEYSSAYINVEQFYGVLSLQKVVLDDSRWTIAENAFELSGLENIELGTEVSSIRADAFKNSKLKYITSRATTPPQIVNNTFNCITTGGTLYYPAGSDYSQWLSTSPYYLGYYGWNGSEIVEEPTYPDGEITAPYDTINISSNGDTLYYIIKTNNIQYLENFYTYADFITVSMIGEDVFPETTFKIEIEKNETLETRSGSVWFTYRDWNNNYISHRLGITQDAKYVEPEEPDVPPTPEEPEVTTPYVTGTTTILYFNYDGTPKTSKEFDVYWYGDYYDRNIANDSSHFGVSGKKIETTDDYVKYHYTVNCPQNTTSEVITGSCYFNIKLDASTYGESFVVEFIQDAKPEDEPDVPDSPSIDLEYNNITAPQGGITSTLDIETNGVEDIEIIAPEWVEVIDKGGYYEIEVLPNEGTDREGEVIFIGNPNKPNKVQQNIIITQKGNEEMATSIGFNKLRLDFAATGGTGYVEVKYINAQTVNAPTCQHTWVTIEEDQIGNTTTDGQPTKQIRYKITMQPSSFARQTNITFSCIGVNGNTVSQDKFMVYQAAPAATVPTISYNKTGIYFDSTGYAEDFGVDVFYENATTILEPFVNGDWITVTEGLPVQGGGSNNTNYIKKHYLIEVTATDAYRQGAVVFKASNDNGTSNSLVFSVIQLAPVEEEEIVPVVSAYTKTATVKYDGSSTGIAITSLGCSYKNVSSVLTPVISGSWIHLSEGVLQSSSSEDTVVYRYPITFDANDSVERVGYVKFIGTDENGNEYSDSTKITQQAAPVTPDEPEPELPEDSKDVTYSPIWKDISYTFVNEEVFSIYHPIRTYLNGKEYVVENLIFKGKAYIAPNSYSVEICVNKICQNYMSEHPNIFDGAVGYSHSYNEFLLRNSYGTLLHTYRFVNDWSYKELSLGVKTNPILPYIGDGQKLFFSAFATEQKTIKWGMRYYDGTADYNNAEYVSNDFLTNVVTDLRQKGVNTFYFGDKSFTVLPKCKCKYVLYYVNPYGGYDWFPITGKVTRKDRLETYTITQNFHNTTTEFGKKRYLSTIDIIYQINTQWLTQEQSDRMWELTESNTVWLHNLEEDKIYPVVITNTEIEHKQKTRNSRMLSYQINVELSQQRERL